jgi:hypothetical protein
MAEIRRSGPRQEAAPKHNNLDATHNTAEVRRAGALRLPPLDCGHRDPWTASHARPEPSARMVDGYRDALEHLEAHGLTGSPLLPELRMLWQRGGSDRRLAQTIAQRWEVAA